MNPNSDYFARVEESLLSALTGAAFLIQTALEAPKEASKTILLSLAETRQKHALYLSGILSSASPPLIGPSCLSRCTGDFHTDLKTAAADLSAAESCLLILSAYAPDRGLRSALLSIESDLTAIRRALCAML